MISVVMFALLLALDSAPPEIKALDASREESASIAILSDLLGQDRPTNVRRQPSQGAVNKNTVWPLCGSTAKHSLLESSRRRYRTGATQGEMHSAAG